MVVSSNVNSSACQVLAVSANNLCKRFSISCYEEVRDSSWVFLCVGVPLAVLSSAILFGFCGKSIQLLKGAAQRCSKGRYQQIYLYEEECSSGSISSYPIRKSNLVKTSCQSYKLFALAITIGVLSFLILSIPKVLKTLCPDNGSCLKLEASTFNGCEWAQKWLLEVAEELIHSEEAKVPVIPV